MTDQDQINEKNCCLVIKGGRLTGQTLALAMRAFLAAGRKVTNHQPTVTKQGKQSVKELAAHGGKLENIQICSEGVKSFENIAQKYAVDYAVMKDFSEELAQGGPAPKHLVFFKSRDAAAMTAAFREFSAKELSKSKEKPPIKQTMQRMMEKVKAQKSKATKEKVKEREVSR